MRSAPEGVNHDTSFLATAIKIPSYFLSAPQTSHTNMLTPLIWLRKRRLLFTQVFAGLALLPTVELPGQVSPPAAPPKEAVVLSPFVVNTDRDTGFVAASSLAGGRLATDLADTPAAYSVLTREFIEALNITSLDQAIDWTVNTNSSNDNGSVELGQVTNLLTTSRGVTAGAPQRNFFPFYVNFDSYNLERFDFSRGPNSILFGNGALGGSANAVTKQARLDRPLREVSATVGSWSKSRATFDVNQPLTERLAIRANGVWEDSRGWRDRDYSKLKGVSLTSTLRVGRATEIRLEGEYGETHRMKAYTTINDGFAGWDGKTTFSAPLGSTPADANAAGIARNSSSSYWVFAPVSGYEGVMSYQNAALTLGAGANSGVPIGGHYFVGTTPNAAGTDINNSFNLPDARFNNALAGSHFARPSRSFTQSFDAPQFWQRYRDVALYLNHSIGRTVFVELALNGNYSYRYAENTMAGLNTTQIDINRNLPNGAPNPNFLVPYSEATRSKNTRAYTFYNVRGAVAWLKDTRFGNFKFSSLFGVNPQRNVARLMAQNARLDPDPRRWVNSHPIRYRYYWNQQSRPLPLLQRATFFDPVQGTTREAVVSFEPDFTRPEINSTTDVTYKYAVAAMNAQFFDRRLIVLTAVRFDGYRNRAAYIPNIRDYPADWDGNTITYKPAAPPDYSSFMYVPRDASGNPTGPTAPALIRPREGGNRLAQYANDRFQDDYNPPDVEEGEVTYSAGSVYHVRPWLSLYANYAETFTIPPANPTLFGTILPATVSSGKDAGIRFSLLDQRVRVSLNRYFSQQDNQPTVNPTQARNHMNQIINANAVGDFSTSGLNIRGLRPLPSVISDRRQMRADGYEIEIVANLTRALRVSTNAAIARVFTANASELTAAYVDQNLPTLQQIVVDAGGRFDSAGIATVDTTIPADQRSPDVNAAVDAWNSLQGVRRGIVPDKILFQNTSSANFFADYTFPSGRLKGVRVGAGARYRGRIVIGNRAADTMVDTANPLRAIDNPTVDANTPVYAPGYTVATATLGYSWRISNQRRVTLNLRVDNLFNEDKPHFMNTILRPPGGDVTTPARIAVPMNYWYQNPRSYTLTTRLSF
jgi:outer membrane receptor protein involved in Fe transport